MRLACHPALVLHFPPSQDVLEGRRADVASQEPGVSQWGSSDSDSPVTRESQTAKTVTASLPHCQDSHCQSSKLAPVSSDGEAHMFWSLQNNVLSEHNIVVFSGPRKIASPIQLTR